MNVSLRILRKQYVKHVTLDNDSKNLKNYLDRLKPLLAIACRDSQNNNIFWQIYLSFIKDIHILFASQSNTNKKTASYIIMKLEGKILVEWKKFIKKRTADTPAATNNTATTDFEIAQRDRDILEYLGGYVMQHLYRKIRKSPQYGSDKNMKVCKKLKAGKSKTIEHQRLINCKSRGGLWGFITCFNIFKVAETVFTSHQGGKF